MKKLFFAFLLCIGLMATAHAAEPKPISGLYIGNIFSALEQAATGTNFIFDGDAAEKSCKVACTATAEVAKDSQVMVTYEKDGGKVTAVTFIIQMAYPEKPQVTEAMLRGVYAVQTLGRLISREISDADLKKMQQSVGITAKGLIQGTPGNMTYDGIELNGIFLSGVYMVAASGK